MSVKDINKLKIRDLDLFYGDKQALKKINMDIKENKVTALIGPSGCGKSTFLRTLNRMNDLIENVTIKGKIEVDGEDIYQTEDVIKLRTKVGMVFQKPNPFPMSIYDNIAYGPRIHGIRDKKILDKIVEESLRGAAIWDEVKDRLKTSALGLSGGQQQRICIARAIAMKPEVISVSYTHLDVYKRQGIIRYWFFRSWSNFENIKWYKRINYSSRDLGYSLHRYSSRIWILCTKYLCMVTGNDNSLYFKKN